MSGRGFSSKLTASVGVLSQHTSGCSDDFTDITIVSLVLSQKKLDSAWWREKRSEVRGYAKR